MVCIRQRNKIKSDKSGQDDAKEDEGLDTEKSRRLKGRGVSRT